MMTLNVRRMLQLLLGAAAGLFAWPLMEALIRAMPIFPNYLAYTAASGAAFGLVFGAALGGAEGIAAARPRRIMTGTLWGALAGLVGGAAGFLLGQGVLFLSGELLTGGSKAARAMAAPLARAAGWATLGVIVGAAAGVRSASARKCGIGALGGLAGGLSGGALIEFGLANFPRSSAVRGVGLVLFGSLLGLSFAAVERRLSFGVLRVLNGPLKGREFLLNQRTTRIGEDPRCDVPLEGYRSVAPVHALIARRGRELVVESLSGPLSVNEVPAEGKLCPLKYDDAIACGSVRFLLRRE